MIKLKKLAVTVALATTLLMSTGCSGKKEKVINGVVYEPYGLFNKDEVENPNIAYKVSVFNLVVGAILIETIIIPVYIVGWDLFEPVGVKPSIKGQAPSEKD